MGFRCVSLVGGLALALLNSNHSSADVYLGGIANMICDDVRLCRVVVLLHEAAARIPGLRVSPLAAIECSTEVRVMHGLMFSSGPPITGVDEDTDCSSASIGEFSQLLRDIIWCILYLCQRFCSGARILLSEMEVQDAFRQVPHEITRAPLFGYVLGDLVVVDRRM